MVSANATHEAQHAKNPMDRLISRIPLLLMLGAILLCVQLSLVQTDESSRIVAAVPLSVLLFFYLRAGRGGGGDE